MKVGAGGLAGETDGRDHISFLHALSRLYGDATRLKMLVKYDTVVVDGDGNIISGGFRSRVVGVGRQREAFHKIDAGGHDHAIAGGQHGDAVAIPISGRVAVAVLKLSLLVGHDEVDGKAAGDVLFAVGGEHHPPVTAFPGGLINGHPRPAPQRHA